MIKRMSSASTLLGTLRVKLYFVFRSGIKSSPPKQESSFSINQTVRQAVREEIGSLIREGLIPTRQTECQAPLKKDGLVLPTRPAEYQASVMKDVQVPSSEQTGYQTPSVKSVQVPSTRQTVYQTPTRNGGLVPVKDTGYQDGQSEQKTGSQGFYIPEGGGMCENLCLIHVFSPQGQ